jgi:hypothetical protein
MSEKRYFHGIVSRFSAGQKVEYAKLAESLKTGFAAGSKVHVRGVNLPSGDLQHLVGSLRHRGVDMSSDGLLSAAGDGMVIFSTSPMTMQSIIALVNSVDRTPAGRRVIDREGYTSLSQDMLCRQR